MTIMRHLAAGGAHAVAAIVLAGSALANPPGQAKKEAEAAEAAPTSHVASTEENSPPGQAKKAEEAATPAPAAAKHEEKQQAKSAEKTSGVNSTTAGVKPSNDTEKNTWTTAGATPDTSKRYGNGTTAAQIATSRGAPASTPIHGPGNSQPHKVCGKNGRFVDVHAVKSYTGTTCAPTIATTTVKTPPASITSVTVTPSTTTTVGVAPATATTATIAPTGVAGDTKTETSSSPGSVAGALGAAAGGVLPFTGFPLWAVALAGLAAIATGWALMRRGRPAARGAV